VDKASLGWQLEDVKDGWCSQSLHCSRHIFPVYVFRTRLLPHLQKVQGDWVHSPGRSWLAKLDPFGEFLEIEVDHGNESVPRQEHEYVNGT